MTGPNPDLIVQVAANITALQADMAKAAATLKQLEDATKSSAAAAIDWSGVMDTATRERHAAIAAIGHRCDDECRPHLLQQLKGSTFEREVLQPVVDPIDQTHQLS